MSETDRQVASSMQMDDFCLDVALILRRVLDIDPAGDGHGDSSPEEHTVENGERDHT